MSVSRFADAPIPRALGDHVCWPFRGREELVEVAVPYIAEGVEHRQRVGVFLRDPDRSLERLRAAWADIDGHIGRGQVVVGDVEQLPGSDPGRHPAEELSILEEMTDEAMDDGYTGLRSFADTTNRITDERRRPEYARYEHLIDHLALAKRCAVMCAYDTVTLGEPPVAEMAAVHSRVHGDLSPFQLAATADADVAIAGSVDAFAAGDLAEALRRIGVPATGAEAVIDARDLDFIDHHGLLAMDHLATEIEATVVLRTPRSTIRRVAELMQLRSLHVELA